MTPPKTSAKLVRTSVLLPPETDQAVRDLARKGKRPVSWEIRHAIEKHVKEAAA